MPRAMLLKPLALMFVFATSLTSALAQTAPQVTLGRAPAGTQMMDAKTGPDGAIHLLLQKEAAPFYAKSTDGGKTASDPIPVITTKINPPGLEFLGWDMSVNDKGKVFVVMGNNAWKLKLPEDRWGMYLSTLEPGANKFGPMMAVTGESGEGFSIAAGKDGHVTVAYLRKYLYWKHSTDDGKTFTANAQVDKDYLPCNCCTTSLAIGKDGTLALLYREATGNRRDMFAILTKDGKHTRVPVSRTLWEINACPMTYYRIAPAGDGFVAAWPTRGQAYFTKMSATGKIWTPGEIKVGGKTGMRSSLFALAGKDDTTLVAWKNEDTLHWRIYDAAGKPLGEEASAPGPGPQAGGVVDKNGGYILFP